MMSASLLLPLALFSFVSAITPGPNNVMLASSGLHYGMRRTVPHMAGIALGFVVMLLVLGLGLGSVFVRWPGLHHVLQWACAAYLLFLAWQIATVPTTLEQARSGRPFSFLQAAGFQWLNPKAWVVAMGIIAVYVPPANFFLNLCLATLVCTLSGLPALVIWTLFGMALRRLLQRPGMVRGFNVCMALLLVVSLYPMLAAQ